MSIVITLGWWLLVPAFWSVIFGYVAVFLLRMEGLGSELLLPALCWFCIIGSLVLVRYLP